jgi:hypothetical protein
MFQERAGQLEIPFVLSKIAKFQTLLSQLVSAVLCAVCPKNARLTDAVDIASSSKPGNLAMTSLVFQHRLILKVKEQYFTGRCSSIQINHLRSPAVRLTCGPISSCFSQLLPLFFQDVITGSPESLALPPTSPLFKRESTPGGWRQLGLRIMGYYTKESQVARGSTALFERITVQVQDERFYKGERCES